MNYQGNMVVWPSWNQHYPFWVMLFQLCYATIIDSNCCWNDIYFIGYSWTIWVWPPSFSLPSLSPTFLPLSSSGRECRSTISMARARSKLNIPENWKIVKSVYRMGYGICDSDARNDICCTLVTWLRTKYSSHWKSMYWTGSPETTTQFVADNIGSGCISNNGMDMGKP